MYAVIATGGKQYRVVPGDVIYVEKLAAEAGDEVAFDVLLYNDDEQLFVGKPLLEDIVVKGVVDKQVKGKKLIVFKMKAKKNYRRKNGHRQPYTRVEITTVGPKAAAAEV